MAAALKPVGTTQFAIGDSVHGDGLQVASSPLRLAPAFGGGAAPLQVGAALFDNYGRDYTLNMASRMQATHGALEQVLKAGPACAPGDWLVSDS